MTFLELARHCEKMPNCGQCDLQHVCAAAGDQAVIVNFVPEMDFIVIASKGLAHTEIILEESK